MVKVLVTHYLSGEIGNASVTLARQAIELENQWPWDGKEETAERKRAHSEVRRLAIGAVILAVASLEGMLNEFLQNAPERLTRLESVRGHISRLDRPLKHITAEGLRNLIALGAVRELPTNAFDKLRQILEAAGLPELPGDRGIGQHLNALVDLRNELVHNVPTARPHGGSVRQNERDPLENTLRGKYKPSTMVYGGYSFCWERGLSADCARWAVCTMHDVENAWFERIGASVRVETTLDEVISDAPRAPWE